jgi:phage recombination protein Bet
MSTATTEKPKSEVSRQNAGPPALAGSRLPYHPVFQERYGIDAITWRALVESIFPTAQSIEAMALVLSYCKARNLDVFKKPCHIVPIWNKELGRLVDTVWPGIGELRTTATRTGAYAGTDPATKGPIITEKVGSVMMEYPEWVQVTVYRIVQGVRCAFPGPEVRYKETYATARRDNDDPNEMWRNRPFGQLEKCAEAAALRKAFPEEMGADYIPEEMERQNGRWQTVVTTSTTIPEGQSKSKAIAEQMKGRLENKPAEVATETASQRETLPVNREAASSEESQDASPAAGEESQLADPAKLEAEVAAKITQAIGIASDNDRLMTLEGEASMIADEEIRLDLYERIKARREVIGKGKAKSGGKLPGT